MQKAARGVRNPAEGRNDGFGWIESNLESLIAQVHASIRVIETAIDREASCAPEENTGGIFVLDDVMPRYAQANAALLACDASLGAALAFLRDGSTSTPRAEAGSRMARLSARV
jgi:hypothetical protein